MTAGASRRVSIAAGAAMALALVALPLYASQYTLTTAIRIVYFGFLALSVGMLVGQGGMVSLTQAAFFGLTGYVVGLLGTERGLPFPLPELVAMAAVVAVSAALALVVMRTHGIVFLMLTLALGQIFWSFARQNTSLLHGWAGIRGIAPPAPFGLDLTRNDVFYWFSLALFAPGILLMRRIVGSPFGLALNGVRESPRRMTALGYPVYWVRVVAFVLAAAYAGVGGILAAWSSGTVTPTTIQLSRMIWVLLLVILGGAGHLWGPVVGTVVAVWLDVILSQLTPRYNTIIGAVFLAVVLLAPDGILGLVDALRRRWGGGGGRGGAPGRRGDVVQGEGRTEPTSKGGSRMIQRAMFAFLGCALLSGTALAAPPPGEVKVGMLSAFTGVFSGFGQLQKEGAVLALEEVGYTAGGKKIVIVYADDQLDNELAVTKAKQLVEQDRVDVLTGMVSGDEGLAVGSYMKGKNIPVIPMYSASEDMTMREWYPYIVRPTWTGAQPMDVFGYWLAKAKGYKRLYMIGEDYSYPYNQGGGLKRGFFAGGGLEVKTVWHPVPTSDYSSIIASIPLDKGYDAVLYNGAGGDAVAFVKQYVELGMPKKIPLIGQSNTFEKPDLDQMPTEIVGALSAHLTADDLSTPQWNRFKDAFVKRWGHAPSAASEFSYNCMRLILRAVDKRKGDVADKAALVKAMREVDMTDAPRGPVKLDAYNAAIQNVYIRQVAMGADGKLFNKGLFTVKNVSQFGPYDAKVYMKQPPDSRSYPPDLREQMPQEVFAGAKGYEYLPFGK